MTADTAAVLKAAIGTERVSPWLTVSQAMIDRFADATGDHQFIHVDPRRAAATPFGGTIAHGFLLLSLLPALLDQAERAAPRPFSIAINYGCDRVRFVTPVRAGARVRARFTTAEVEERHPGRFQQVTDVVLELEGSERPAATVRWLSQIVA